jgi:GAF domain-containing protein
MSLSVAGLFRPLRQRLRRTAEHLTSGRRDGASSVPSGTDRCVEAAVDAEEALAAVVQAVRDAFDLPYAAIALKEGDDFVVAAASGTPVGGLVGTPLVYQGETVGQLALASPAAGTFEGDDRRRLDELVRQAEVVAHAVRRTSLGIACEGCPSLDLCGPSSSPGSAGVPVGSRHRGRAGRPRSQGTI